MVQLWSVCAVFFCFFPALPGRGWLARRTERRYGATVERLRHIFFDACWISFLIHVMLCNFVIRIADHPARADKSAPTEGRIMMCNHTNSVPPGVSRTSKPRAIN